jgi:cellulose synthase/poly-beta-1,6-N-acetylglucosamine synthase-like glycosyltransferase
MSLFKIHPYPASPLARGRRKGGGLFSFAFTPQSARIKANIMTLIGSAILYIFLFLSVYVQVFFFITFLQNRKNIVTRKGEIKLSKYPAVTVAVPCWNEETTVYKTVRSLMGLNYPKNKLTIFLIDDGSTDNTLQVLNRFSKYPNIQVFHKENGGKHTALNLALANTETDFFGCLDADSFIDPEALVRIMSYYEKYPNTMAVVPSVTVNHDSKNYLQSAQRAEYYMGVYFKKMLDFLGAIDVTPGPFTIFRKKVFDDLGGYVHGNNTEDMEIAFRMQKNDYKIKHCNDAFVYTNTPKTVKKLYKQRVRWIFGFINNTIDYKDVLFKKKYGNFSVFTLPTRIASVIAVGYVSLRVFYNLGSYLYTKYVLYKNVVFALHVKSIVFDPFFINTQAFFFIVIVSYFLLIFSIIFGRKLVENKWTFSPSMLYFFPVFTLIAPFWLAKAVYNTVMKRRPAWR